MNESVIRTSYRFKEGLKKSRLHEDKFICIFKQYQTPHKSQTRFNLTLINTFSSISKRRIYHPLDL